MSFLLDDAVTLLGQVFAPWVQQLNLQVLEVDDNSATLLMPFSPALCREGGILCGQSMMALADTSAVFAICAASGQYRGMATVDQTIHLLKPVSNQDAIAKASVIRLGRNMAFVRVDITGSKDRKPVSTAQLAYALEAG